MAADTFGQAWRILRLHCPALTPMLAQYFVQKAYQDVCDEKAWSWLRAENEFLINTQKTGTANVTRGSDTVSGGSISYASSDAGRQFRAGTSSPIYTIIAADGTHYQLDRVWGDTTATAASCTVLDAYMTMPEDFQRFMAVLDVHNNWQLHLWIEEEELNRWDAQRSATGTPWAVVSRRLATAGPNTGRAQYELWPYQVAQYNYPYYYIRRPEALTDSTAFLGPLAKDSNILVTMALAEAAEWPGNGQDKNPMFNPTLAQMKRKKAREDLDRLHVLDEEMYLTWWDTQGPRVFPFAPIDSRFLQSHDFPSARDFRVRG